MIQRGNRPGFALEAIVELTRGNFDRDRPAQARIRAPIDFTHPAFADQTDNLVGPNLSPAESFIW